MAGGRRWPGTFASMATARLLVVRHGQSVWNAEGRWQGSLDPPLSTLGVRQARHAATALGSFDVVAASDLDRARTTAEIIANESGVGPVVIEPGLRERHAGAFEGLTKPEIRERFPGFLEERRNPEGWEDDDAVLARAVPALARIAALAGDGGTALVVSHGGVIGCVERLLDVRRDHRLANLGGRWFEVGVDGEGRPRLVAGDDVVLVEADEVTVPDQI